MARTATAKQKADKKKRRRQRMATRARDFAKHLHAIQRHAHEALRALDARNLDQCLASLNQIEPAFDEAEFAASDIMSWDAWSPDTATSRKDL